MKLLYLGGWETSHLNDALARVIVEMIKREWPQQWPTLLAELSDACSRGHRHTQIVLHVFLRLAEDVAILQVSSIVFVANQSLLNLFQSPIMLTICWAAIITHLTSDIWVKLIISIFHYFNLLLMIL